MKKTLITVLVTVLVCCTAFGATYAWLMDKTATITNTFTFGDVSITLEETEGEGNDTAKTFKMVPGATIDKDPKVSVVAGSEACWLFVKIDASANYSEFFATYVVADGWTALTGNAGVYYRSVTASDNAQDFYVLKDNQVTVLDTVTQAQFNAIKNGSASAPTLSFTAYAVQSEGVGDAATAWGIANSNP